MAESQTGDVGQELAYNKRNRLKSGLVWADIADKEVSLRISEVVKSKVYPRPDYRALIDSGVPNIAAYHVKAVYDSISVKPKTSNPSDENLQAYIEGVGQVMNAALVWARDISAVKAWIGGAIAHQGVVERALGGASVPVLGLIDRPHATGKSLLDAAFPDGWKNSKPLLRLIGGNSVLAALQPRANDAVDGVKAIRAGWPASVEAWQKRGMSIVLGQAISFESADAKMGGVSGKYAVLRMKDSGKELLLDSKFSEGSQLDSLKEWGEQRKVELEGKQLLLDKFGRLIGAFVSREEAVVRAKELIARKAKETVSEKGISVERAQRTGPAHRQEGVEISSEALMITFGFRGVNFGNWMQGDANANERQMHLNHAYDAFMDLASILEVPPSAISLNGLLGLAFGAQGNGKAAAHFVPGLNEINVTRTAGAGAIAHEWAHAFDHSLARQFGLDRVETPYLTEHTKKGLDRHGNNLEPIVALNVICNVMKSRNLTDDEIASKQENSIVAARNRMRTWTKAARRDFERDCFNDPSVMGKLDSLFARIESQDMGGSQTNVGARALSPVVIQIRDLYKARVGRTFSLDDADGLERSAQHLKYVKENPYRPSNSGATLTGPSRFVTGALELDKAKGGKQYWSTTIEMFARSFDAYVYEKLKAKDQVNTYLCGLNTSCERSSPTGDERAAIVSAFDNLFNVVEAKETEQGVLLCGPSSDSFKEDGQRFMRQSA